MTSITRNFNTDENFWDTNPSFKSIKAFSEFLEKDKSRKKGKSSQIMWAVAFLVDPHQDNPWKNLSDTDKKLLIVDDYLKVKDFKWEDYTLIVDEYYKRVLTSAERDYFELVEKMTERKEFIKTTPYSLDSYEFNEKTGKSKKIPGNAMALDKMVVDTVKLYDQLEIIKQKLEKQAQIDGETKAGMQESATEKGLL